MKKPIQVFGFRIENVTDDSVDVHIDGDIVDGSTQEILKSWFGDTTSVSFKSFRNELEKHKVKTYNVYINSPGGHVGDALAIHDLLVDLQGKKKIVKTYGRGVVASAATFILLASDSPEMSENSFFMIHDVSGGVWGSVDEVERQAQVMRKFNNAIRDLYAKKTGMRKEDVSKLMSNETWFTAAEAKEKGFIKEISGEAKFSNKIEAQIWNMYDYTDQSVLVAYNNSVQPPTKEDSLTNEIKDMKNILKDLGTQIKNAISGVKPTAETTNEQLVSQIADAVSNAFSGFSDNFENQITALVNTAVTAATKDLKPAETPEPVVPDIKDIKVGDITLEAKLEELDEAIEGLNGSMPTKLGGASQATATTNKKVVPIGGFD